MKKIKLKSYLLFIISLSKLATQSSISQWSQNQDKILDATNTLIGKLVHNSYTFHTNLEENPWWIVDLEKEEYIYIQNRIKDYKERTKTL